MHKSQIEEHLLLFFCCKLRTKISESRTFCKKIKSIIYFTTVILQWHFLLIWTTVHPVTEPTAYLFILILVTAFFYTVQKCNSLQVSYNKKQKLDFKKNPVAPSLPYRQGYSNSSNVALLLYSSSNTALHHQRSKGRTGTLTKIKCEA